MRGDSKTEMPFSKRSCSFRKPTITVMGNTCKEDVVDVGEQVFFTNGPVEDLEGRRSAGTWLGKGWRIGEHLIHSEEEIT